MLGPRRLLADLERLPVERFSLVVHAHGMVMHGQVVEAYGRVGVVGPQLLLADLERLHQEWFGLVVGAHGLVQRRQVVKAGDRVGVLGPQRLLIDLERLLVARFGLSVRARGLIEQREVVEDGGHVGVVGPQRLFLNSKQCFSDRNGFPILALLIQFDHLLVQHARVIVLSKQTRTLAKKEAQAQEQNQPFSQRLHQKSSRFVHALGFVPLTVAPR